MTDEIIDLAKARNARDNPGPDPEFIMKDDFGRTMFTYLLDYEYQNANWSIRLWAYSEEDAEARVAAMRESLKCMGQLHQVIEA